MEIIDSYQCFRETDDGIRFAYSHFLFQHDGTFYSAKSPARTVGSEDKWYDVTPIPPTLYQPEVPAGCSVALDPGSWYTKRPDPMSACDGDDSTSQVLMEIAACEMIRRRPHPNLAAYHGCVVSDNRVTGICFNRNRVSLMNSVNPRLLNKGDLIRSTDRKAARERAVRYLPGIEAGIRHLHTLGLVHNDLNPANVMISDDDVPVIIDFGSCCAPGSDLSCVGRTPGWFDPSVCEVKPSNDLDALQEIRVWMTGSKEEEFQFSDGMSAR